MGCDEDVNGTALDPDYVPDALDALPAHASAEGMIYSFYARLSAVNLTRCRCARRVEDRGHGRAQHTLKISV